MSRYPNIFEFATKEFTQDAMILWLLKCCSVKDDKDTEMYKIGVDFLEKFILKNGELNNGFEFEWLEKQCSKIDVYASIETAKKYYPIIFENKANTSLHENQLKKYCEKVNGWINNLEKVNNKKAGNIYFVIFKTGYQFKPEKDYIQKEYEKLKNIDDGNVFNKVKKIEIDLSKMIDFLRNHKSKNIILELYFEYLINIKSKQDQLAEQWNDASSESLTTHIGQGNFFEAAFGEGCNIQTGNSGKTEYTWYDIYNNEKNYYTLFRFEPRWVKKNKENNESILKTYLQLQIYREKRFKSNDKEDIWFKENETIARKCCEDLLSNYIESDDEYRDENITVNFKMRKKRQPNYNGAEIFRITFSNYENKPKNVADFIKKFKLKFIDMARNT